MAGQGPRLSTWALQTFVLKKKKKILQHELRPAACRRKGLWPSELGGAGSRSHHPGAGALTRPIRFRAGREGAGSAQARWRPPVRRGAGAAPCRQAGPPSRPRGTPHVSASLCAPPAPRQPLSAAGAQGECLRASASVRGPSEGVSGFPEALRLTEEDEPPDFHSAALRGLLSPALELSQHTCGCGTRPVCAVSAPPTSLERSSLRPQLQNSCSARLRMVLQVDCLQI